jgi:monofunctional glycosyltransferase
MLILLGLSVFFVLLYRWVPVPVTPLMVIRNVEQVVDGRTFRLKKHWVPLKNISSNMQVAVICSEDQNFVSHHGFDFQAIDKAVKHNKHSKHKRGASTISQQTAKNVFLWPGRSWIRKGFEVYFTAMIELCWSKERIMEVYLNVIEFGDGIYGAEAASKFYFHKPARNISRPEAALLTVVLPNPLKYSVSKPSTYIKRRQVWVLRQMHYYGGRVNYSTTLKD